MTAVVFDADFTYGWHKVVVSIEEWVAGKWVILGSTIAKHGTNTIPLSKALPDTYRIKHTHHGVTHG